MRSALAVLIAAISLHAAAEPRGARLQHAHDLLKSGQHKAALEAYQELQVDAPDAPVLRYGIATAHYRIGEAQASEGAPQPARAAFEQAAELYASLRAGDDAAFEAAAWFGEANARTSLALTQLEQLPYPEAVGALRTAAEEYEALLARHPEFEKARQNLDHVRYRLKLLLQNPPESEQQPEPPQQPPAMFIGFTQAETELPRTQAVIEAEGAAVRLRPSGEEDAP